MHVTFFPGAPAFHQPLRVLDHGLRIRSDARTMEGGLYEPPLPQPEIPFAGEQPFSKNMPVRAQYPALEVAARMADQYLFNEVRVIDKNVAKIDHADADDIPVV